MLKFAHYTGAVPIAGRYTPGMFTNQIQAKFREPRLLIVSDPRYDHQVCHCVYMLGREEGEVGTYSPGLSLCVYMWEGRRERVSTHSIIVGVHVGERALLL